MKFKKRIELLVKKNLFFQRLYSFFGSVFFRFIGLFVVQDKNLIVFSSFGGDSINDSPRVIYDYIIANYPQYKTVWTINDSKKRVLENTAYVKVDTLKYFLTCLKARYWVTNVNIERGLHFKKKKTFYLNTWHSTTIKTIGNQVKGRKDYNFKNINLLCSDGPFMSNIFKQYFNAPSESIAECGRPREDELMLKNSAIEKEKMRNKYGIASNKFVILYAPTWKDTNGREDLLTIGLNLSNILNKLGDNTIILFKAHHLTKHTSGIEFNNNILNVSDCLNINELYFASDVLISDYSSCFFDFALLNKPIVCFATDFEEYRNGRGLCVDLKNDFPGGVIENEDELIVRLLELKSGNNFNKKQQDIFLKKYVKRPKDSATVFCVERMLKE